jgi:GNAT superfamily N-acetyltransferase
MTLEEIIQRAAAEGWRIRPPTLKAVPIVAREEDGRERPVGFYCPHPAGRGRMRVGPIYVLPEYRGRRLAEQAYRDLHVPLFAYVHDGNTASQRLHERCGFARWYRGRGGWYWVRD